MHKSAVLKSMGAVVLVGGMLLPGRLAAENYDFDLGLDRPEVSNGRLVFEYAITALEWPAERPNIDHGDAFALNYAWHFNERMTADSSFALFWGFGAAFVAQSVDENFARLLNYELMGRYHLGAAWNLFPALRLEVGGYVGLGFGVIDIEEIPDYKGESFTTVWAGDAVGEAGANLDLVLSSGDLEAMVGIGYRVDTVTYTVESDFNRDVGIKFNNEYWSVRAGVGWNF